MGALYAPWWAEIGFIVPAAGEASGFEFAATEMESCDESNGFGVVGVTGLVGWLDPEGSVSLPSLVRFFLRKPPRLGIRDSEGAGAPSQPFHLGTAG